MRRTAPSRHSGSSPRRPERETDGIGSIRYGSSIWFRQSPLKVHQGWGGSDLRECTGSKERHGAAPRAEYLNRDGTLTDADYWTVTVEGTETPEHIVLDFWQRHRPDVA